MHKCNVAEILTLCRCLMMEKLWPCELKVWTHTEQQKLMVNPAMFPCLITFVCLFLPWKLDDETVQNIYELVLKYATPRSESTQTVTGKVQRTGMNSIAANNKTNKQEGHWSADEHRWKAGSLPDHTHNQILEWKMHRPRSTGNWKAKKWNVQALQCVVLKS